MTTVEYKLKELKMIDESAKWFLADKQAAIDDILTPEIKAKLEEIDRCYAEGLANIQEKARYIEREIKIAVLENGATVKGENYQAVFVKGRTTWDTKALNGYALAHPEINELKKIGSPSVRIKR